jgi:hypothetical protein
LHKRLSPVAGVFFVRSTRYAVGSGLQRASFSSHAGEFITLENRPDFRAIDTKVRESADLMIRDCVF